MRKLTISENQEQWLHDHYANTKNKDIAATFGISVSSVERLAKRFGLKKSKAFIRAISKEAAAAFSLKHQLFGGYPEKGFRIPGRENNWFKKGEPIGVRLGIAKDLERQQKIKESRAKTMRSERARVAFGLPQHTKLRTQPQPKARTGLRYRLRKLGYRLDDDKRVAYYNDTTRRSMITEGHKQPWYKFAPDPDAISSIGVSEAR